MCVEAANAEREARRLETLHKKNLASREATELGRTRAQAGEFACQAARDEEQVAEASLQMNQVLLDETYLRAPFAGIVAEINGEIGEYVTPSPPGVATPPAVDLIDYSCLYVTAPIDEVDAGELAAGLPARLSLDAFRGETSAERWTASRPMCWTWRSRRAPWKSMCCSMTRRADPTAGGLQRGYRYHPGDPRGRAARAH